MSEKLNFTPIRVEIQKICGDISGHVWDSIHDYMRSIAEKKVENVKKAFGGCEKCFGKGFSTQIRGMHGAEDFGGDGFDTVPREEINFCTCERGKNLKKYYERDVSEARTKALDEAIAVIEEENEEKYAGWLNNYELQLQIAKEVRKLK